MEPLRILIVEDELITAVDIEEHLVKAGYIVTAIARTYEEALEAVRHQPPDLALIDVRLQGAIDGIATARELLRYKWMPIIYLTAQNERETFERAKTTHPAGYLLKPFRAADLPLQLELALYNFYNGHVPTRTQTADHLFVLIDQAYVRLYKSEILYAVAAGSYVHVYVSDEAHARLRVPPAKLNPLTLSMTLGRLADHLPTHFYRLSRSLVVNLDGIDRVGTDELTLRNHTIPLPEKTRKPLLELLAAVRTK
jgi:DNA-binding LytR/AlgR family response regulator